MPNAVKWGAPSAASTVFSSIGALTASGGKAITTTAVSGNRERWSDWELVVTFASAPTLYDGVEVYFLPSVDGTNYSDGGTSIDPSIGPAAVFPVRAVTAAQRIVARQVQLPTTPFHVLVRNGATQAFSSGTHTLKYVSYNEEVQ